MEQTLIKLRRALEEGYDIQRKRNAYRTPAIPKAGDPDYKSFEHSMGEHYRQNHRPQDFTEWTDNLAALFSTARLNFGRFKHIVDSGVDLDTDSYAKAFKRQLDELDKIANDTDYLKTYVLLPSHPEVTFEGHRLVQGYQFHNFNQSNPHTISLLTVLWEDRKIENEDGKVLRTGKTTPLAQIYKNLNLNHNSFDLTVRAIHAAALRKKIDLKIRYPKQQVQLVVIQDSM